MDENKMPENDGWKKNARLAIYAMAGFYLLTLAYQMFRAISRSQRRRKVEIINITSQEKTSGKVKLAGSFFAYMMSQVQIGACTRICI